MTRDAWPFNPGDVLEVKLMGQTEWIRGTVTWVKVGRVFGTEITIKYEDHGRPVELTFPYRQGQVRRPTAPVNHTGLQAGDVDLAPTNNVMLICALCRSETLVTFRVREGFWYGRNACPACIREHELLVVDLPRVAWDEKYQPPKEETK